MPAPADRKVRIFISSTFRDMHAERDHLVTVVFPELRERCERLGLEFFDVDLRWGVPEKTLDGETANSWEYCRQWIDRVEPFFICILGQRYGWEPPPEKLKNPDEAARQRLEPRSITDMEVRYAVLDSKLKHHSYFHLRKAEAPATATDFVDPPPLLAKLNQLKAEVRACGRPVHDYPCEWAGDHFTKMEVFGEKVLEDLWSGVLRDPRYVSRDVWQQVLGTDPDRDERYTNASLPVPDDIAEKLIPLAKPPPKNPLEAEREQMAAFAASRLRWFQGRTKELADLTAFIRDPSEDNKPRLALIAAVPGQGKSALMARLWETLQPKETKEEKDETGGVLSPLSAAASDGRALGPPSASSQSPKAEDKERRVEDNAPYLIAHFVGATESSSTAYALVKRLNDELDASGIVFPERPTPEGQPKEEPKLDFQSLCQRLWDRLGDYAGEKRIVILLDALNQLDDGHDLGWLPYRLGPSVRVVVSCIENEGRKMEGRKISENVSTPNLPAQETTPAQKVLAALDSRHPKPKRIPLGPLTADDVHTIVTSYLREYCKELDAPHVDALCDEKKLPQARNPLYLLVMLAELRTLGGNDMNQHVPALIASMGTLHPDTVSLFHWVLERLEQAEGFGEQAVRWWCLYLALGRVGMSSRELSDLLVRKLGDDAAPTAQRIQRALRRFLQRRGKQWDFFHGQLRQAVTERCGGEQRIVQGHRNIATYFSDLADPESNQSWKGDSPRPFLQVVFHLASAQRLDELCQTLCDLSFVEARCRLGQVFELIADYGLAQANLPEAQAEQAAQRQRDDRIARWTAEIIKYARKWKEGRERPALPEIIQSVEPWSQERIEAECARMIGNPTRLDRLRAFGGFVGAECYPLLEFGKRPGFVAQHAFNQMPGGAVHEAAARLATSAGVPLLLRHWPSNGASNPRPALLRKLAGHSKDVSSVSVTADGGLAVSGSSDKTLRVWDLASGRCLHTLDGHNESVTSVSVTPDGRLAVSGSEDKTLRVWDLASWQCLRTLDGHNESVTSVSVTPDGCLAVSGSGDKTLRVWDLDSGQCLRTMQGHSKTVWSVSMRSDGRVAVSGSDDHTLRVWDLESGQCLHTLEGHRNSVFSVSVTPDGRRAVSGSIDETLRVWDLETGQCLHTMEGHSNSVLSVSVTPDGLRAVSGSEDDSLRVWDLENGQCRRTLEGNSGWVNTVSMTPDGRWTVSGSRDKMLRVWALESGQDLRSMEGHSAGGVCISVTPDGRHAVSGSRDKTLRVWAMGSGQCVRTLEGHSGSVSSVSVTPDGLRAVSASWDKTLRVWDMKSGKCLRTLEGHGDSVWRVSVTPDGRRAISGSSDDTLRVWDLDSGQCLRTLVSHRNSFLSISVAVDGHRAVSWSNNHICVWDLESRRCLHTLEGHSARVTRVSLTPDGHLAVSGSDDHTLRVWDLDSGQCLCMLKGHSAMVDSLCVTPDGRCVVSGSWDKTLRVWDLGIGRCLRTLDGNCGWVTSVSVSPDGRLAVSGSRDKTVRLWDVGSGRCLTIVSVDWDLDFVRFTAINRLILGTENGDVIVFDVTGISFGPAISTAARSSDSSAPLSVRCPCCGKEFPVPEPAASAILSHTALLKSDPSPSHILPSSAFDDPLLLSNCPHCASALKFNPFFVDMVSSKDAAPKA